MSASFPATLLTPEGIAFEQDVTSVYVPALSGEMEVLAGHEEMLVFLDSGPVALRKAGNKAAFYYITGGVLDIRADKTTLLCEGVLSLDRVDDKSLESAIAELENKRNPQTEELTREAEMTDAQVIRVKVEIIRRLKNEK